MPIAKDVKEVLAMLRGLGLQVAIVSGSGHYKVTDPQTGVYLFGVSSSPSDPNFRWMIMRHLRRLGLLRDEKLSKTYGKGVKSPKRKAAIDLVALKKAQDAAASAGHRIPTLDDLEDSTEFFTRIRESSKVSHYSPDAQEEAIDIMAANADAPRVNASRQRFAKFMEAHAEELRVKTRKLKPNTPPKRGEYTELARVAMEEVAPARGLRAWGTPKSAQQAFRNFLQTDMAPRLWALTLIEATMDHIEGLKWGEIDESRKRLIPESQFPPMEARIEAEKDEPGEYIFEVKDEIIKESPFPQPPLESVEKGLVPDREIPGKPADVVEIAGQVIPVELEADHIRERYAEALLDILKTEGSQTGEEILSRLDKLSGIA